MPVPAEANPQAGTERSLPLPSAPSPLGRLVDIDVDVGADINIDVEVVTC